MIRALLFDAAGTLIEPLEPVAEVYARHAAAAGLPLEVAAIRQAFARIFSGIGDPEWDAHREGDEAEREWWSRVVGMTLGDAAGASLPGERVQECFTTLFDHYASPVAWRVFPEVTAVLDEARRAGFRVGVVSNFDRRLHRILEGHPFEFILTSADARARKPDPAIFRQALERLGLPPEQVLHAGDSRTADLAGAEGAGIGAFLIERPASDLRAFLATARARRGK